MSGPLAVHSLLPDGRVRCDERAAHATTEARNVTCKECLRMMETAERAKALQTIPPERWP